MMLISSAITLFFLQDSRITNGEVVGYREIENYAPFGLFAANEAKRFFVETQYQALNSDGKQQLYTVSAGRGATKQEYKIGDSMSIRYQNRRPEHARINTIPDIWGGSMIFLALAVIFGLLGWAARFAFRLGNNGES